MIRRARLSDVPALGKIINDAAEYGLMLHRSWADLYENVRDFYVADVDGSIQGVCGLKIVWANLAEVYALAVSPASRGRGLGSKLVEASVADAQTLGIQRVMSLTYERSFFERLGFEVVDRQMLPLKVWSECIRCPKNHACDEIAMVRTLDVPVVEAPPANDVIDEEYEVPVQLGIRGNKRSE